MPKRSQVEIQKREMRQKVLLPRLLPRRAVRAEDGDEGSLQNRSSLQEEAVSQQTAPHT